MEAVKAGDADVAFVYYYTAQEFVNNDSSGSVRYSLVNQPSFQYRIALAPRINHALAGVLRKESMHYRIERLQILRLVIQLIKLLI